jgi:hypothetical protein
VASRGFTRRAIDRIGTGTGTDAARRIATVLPMPLSFERFVIYFITT